MNNQVVKILITGDFCPLNRIEALIEKEDYRTIFDDFLPLVKGSDIAITNLECPLTMGGVKIIKTGPHLKASVKTIEALTYAGFNLVSLANNHIMDYGVDGLNSTIELCEKSGIDYVGAGSNLQEARKPYYKEINGIRIAIINFCENEWSTTSGKNPGANPLNPVANYYDIKEAKAKADHVIVILHGGHELYPLPSPRMQETYRFFVDAGASIVIGHHPHCFSGYEIYHDAPIFYSLGNFIFDLNNKKRTSWNMGYAVQLNVGVDEISYSLQPYSQGDIQSGVRLLDTPEKEKIIEEIFRLNNLIGNEILLKQEFDIFKLKRKDSYESFIEPFNFRPLSILYARNLFPSFLTSNKRNLLLNLIRCEAHRDLLMKILDD
jgi:hypothetical protein